MKSLPIYWPLSEKNIYNGISNRQQKRSLSSYDKLARQQCWQLHSICSNCSKKHWICKCAKDVRRCRFCLIGQAPVCDGDALRLACQNHASWDQCPVSGRWTSFNMTRVESARESTSSREDALKPNIDCLLTSYPRPIFAYCLKTYKRACLWNRWL